MRSAALRSLNRPVNLLGHSYPLVAVALAGFTLALSVLAALGQRAWGPVLETLALIPQAVFSGQLWRLLSWAYVELDPLSLVFACLVLLFCGRDFSYAWGPWRLLGLHAGLAAGAALGTCLLSLAWPTLRSQAYLEPWAVASAFLVVWALRFPRQEILFMFVLRMRGRHLAYATLGLTVLFALMGGLARFVPHFCALALAWAWAQVDTPRALWLRGRYRWLQWRHRRHLRPVERPGASGGWRH